MVPSKWHWKRSSYEHVASCNFCYWSGWNDREPKRRWKHEDVYEVAELTSHKKPGFQKESFDWVGKRGETKRQLPEWIMWKNVIYRAALHRPIHQLWFCLSHGLNWPGGSTIPNLVLSHSFYILPVIPQIPSLRPKERVRKPTGPKRATFDGALVLLGSRSRNSTSVCVPSWLLSVPCYAHCETAVVLLFQPSLWCVPELGREARLYVSVHVAHILSCTHFGAPHLTQTNKTLLPSQLKSSSLEEFPRWCSVLLYQSTPHINHCGKVQL